MVLEIGKKIHYLSLMLLCCIVSSCSLYYVVVCFSSVCVCVCVCLTLRLWIFGVDSVLGKFGLCCQYYSFYFSMSSLYLTTLKCLVSWWGGIGSSKFLLFNSNYIKRKHTHCATGRSM